MIVDTVIPLIRHRAPARRAIRPPETARAELAERLLALHERLLGCDNDDLLLQRFLSWAEGGELAQGLGLHLDSESAERQLGQSHPYRCTYRLQLDGEYLGEITLMRHAQYEEAHLVAIERGLGALAKGLRLARERQRLEDLATRDALTRLLNRNALDEGLATEFARARRVGAPLSLLLLDVDDFKSLNDHHGHLAGDRALRGIGEILLASTRDTDLVFRHGGDEFAVLMPGTDEDIAADVAARIRENLSRGLLQPADAEGKKDLALPRVSIGIAAHRPGETPTALLERADQALYRAKAVRSRLAEQAP
jgi:diguanylate cyclase (GGDEF)-like protein